MNLSLVICFLCLISTAVNARDGQTKNDQSMAGFSFYRPTREERRETVVNSDPNELNRWCPSAIRRDLQPYCVCIGPRIFPVISCQQLNNELEVKRLKNIRFPNINIGKFRFNDSTITKFDAFSMPLNMSIQYVEIEKTRIAEIDLRAFIAATDTLIRLTVVHNNLSKFPYSYLKYFTRLQFLDLFYNSLTQIPDFAFGSNSALTHIDLSFNSIAYVGSYAFNDLPNLKKLDLRFNKIKVLNNNAFTSRFPKYDLSDGLALDLSHNKMFYVADDAFRRTTFKKLDISQNILKKFSSKPFEPILRAMLMIGKGSIVVEGNKFQCNCNSTGWLIRLPKMAKSFIHGFKCDTPQRLNHKSLHSLTKNDIGCYYQ